MINNALLNGEGPQFCHDDETRVLTDNGLKYRIELDIEKGKLKDKGKGLVFDIKPVPAVMKKLLEDGGVVEHFRKHGGFKFD